MPSPAKAQRAKRKLHARKRPISEDTPSLFSESQNSINFDAGGKIVHLTNLRKIFWPGRIIAKRDLLQFYSDIAPLLLPHLAGRAMVMKRYPNGIADDFFFMKRAPTPRPEWIETCGIEHGSGSVIDFPVINDLASLLWVINLGCIDLNPWYARCDDVDRPDYLHFDLDPVNGASWTQMLEAAALVHESLSKLKLPAYIKTTGSRGFHIYVPIVRGPTQKEVWSFAKQFATSLSALRPDLLTAEYRIAKRPQRRVLVDYNQNAWGRTLASVYSVRPQPDATVSAPITWKELERGVKIEDFRLDNMRQRLKTVGDLWSPVLAQKGRAKLDAFYAANG
jgi:bifunctional non-homologous end joining protein LigD